MGRSLAATIVLAAALVPAAAGRAAEGDGFWLGSLACGAVGASPGFTLEIAVTVRDGAFAYRRGEPGRSGFEEVAGRIEPTGRVTVTGRYWAEIEKPLAYEGRVQGTALRAAGRRGPRDCTLRLEAPPPSGLKPPFAGPLRPGARRATATDKAPVACPAPPPPLRDLDAEPFYRRDDPTHSEIDPEAMAAYQKAVAPLRAYETRVAELGDRHLRGADPEAARCLGRWLVAWAEGGALLGRVSALQGGFERKWHLAALALNYVLIRDDADALTPAQHAAVRLWLRDLGDAMVPYYEKRTGGAARNNHLNWAALAALAAGVAVGDGSLVDWGLDAARRALAQVDAEGFLPLELERGGRALTYHVFALQPLALAATIAARNGLDLYAENEGALARLARRVGEGLADPAPFAARSGRAQVFSSGDGPGRGDFAWAELLYAETRDAALMTLIAPRRPIRVTWLGGDVTLRYGAPAE